MSKRLTGITIVVVLILAGTSFFLFTQKGRNNQSAEIVTFQAQPSVVTATASSTAQKKQFSKEAAQSFFNNFVNLEQTFDPKVSDLYSENAVVKSTRIYPNGTTRDLEIPMSQYKTLLITGLSIAKQNNDKSTYSDVNYEIGENSIKISAKRFNERKKYSANYYLILKDESGELKIIEEFSESQP